MIKLTVLSSESTETMKKQNNEKDEFQQKESTPLLVHKSKTLQHRIYYNSKLLLSALLNWFMGRLGRATCKVPFISAPTC